MRQAPLGAMLAVDVIRNQDHRPRAIERVGGDQIFDPVGLHLHQQVLHTARLELENTFCFAGRKQLENLSIGNIEFFKVDFLSLNFLD